MAINIKAPFAQFALFTLVVSPNAQTNSIIIPTKGIDVINKVRTNSDILTTCGLVWIFHVLNLIFSHF